MQVRLLHLGGNADATAADNFCCHGHCHDGGLQSCTGAARSSAIDESGADDALRGRLHDYVTMTAEAMRNRP